MTKKQTTQWLNPVVSSSDPACVVGGGWGEDVSVRDKQLTHQNKDLSILSTVLSHNMGFCVGTGLNRKSDSWVKRRKQEFNSVYGPVHGNSFSATFVSRHYLNYKCRYSSCISKNVYYFCGNSCINIRVFISMTTILNE